MNALFSLLFSCSLTCQYPDFKSNLKKYFANPSDASMLLITGGVRAYIFVIL